MTIGQSNWTREHLRRYKESGGADGHIWDGLDGATRYQGKFHTLLLTTTGRRSQKRRTTPLIYGRDTKDYIIVASQGGRANHPGWYQNLDVNPAVELQVTADIFPATARTVSGTEREGLWKVMTEL